MVGSRSRIHNDHETLEERRCCILVTQFDDSYLTQRPTIGLALAQSAVRV